MHKLPLLPTYSSCAPVFFLNQNSQNQHADPTRPPPGHFAAARRSTAHHGTTTISSFTLTPQIRNPGSVTASMGDFIWRKGTSSRLRRGGKNFNERVETSFRNLELDVVGKFSSAFVGFTARMEYSLQRLQDEGSPLCNPLRLARMSRDNIDAVLRNTTL